ncbi:L,D-transpeptidase family protein [Loktanella fryxellensis]|nr:L,D-transpeptidase family protein [Loktanella fryxellensis]
MNRRMLVLGAMGAALAACGRPQPTRFKRYDGPKVTRVQVFKARRKLQIFSANVMLKEYDMELGFAPTGHKAVEGDGRTPEGAYRIDRRNPNSSFHLSIGISYPNANDIARAAAMGQRPGGDIFIHGTPARQMGKSDWTYGCIAVTNDEMEDIYAMVPDGTPIYIYP